MTINIKIALVNASVAWCSGQYAGLLLVESGFDAVLGFDFYSPRIWFLMCYSGWGRVVVIE